MTNTQRVALYSLLNHPQQTNKTTKKKESKFNFCVSFLRVYVVAWVKGGDVEWQWYELGICFATEHNNGFKSSFYI